MGYSEADLIAMGFPTTLEVGVNHPPIANAGENLNVSSNVVTDTVIPGTATDPDEADVLQYRWLEGDLVLLDWTPVDINGECPLELVGLGLTIGAHTLVLEVTDGKATAADEMILTIGNSAPNAAPSGEGSYPIESSFPLTGQVSDFDGDLLTYAWKEGADVFCSGSVQTTLGGDPVSLPDTCIVAGLGLGCQPSRLRCQTE